MVIGRAADTGLAQNLNAWPSARSRQTHLDLYRDRYWHVTRTQQCIGVKSLVYKHPIPNSVTVSYHHVDVLKGAPLGISTALCASLGTS